MMYAQLFRISEEDNHYPEGEMIPVDNRLVGLLDLPADVDAETHYWHYTELNDRQTALAGGLTVVDFNSKI